MTDGSRRKLVALLAAIACAIAVWLSLYQVGAVAQPWDPLFGNGTAVVLGSSVANSIRGSLGIPDAALGAVAYGAECLLALGARQGRTRFLYGFLALALGLVGVALIGVQALVVRAFCFLCLVTAAISIANAFLAWGELREFIRGR